MLVGLGASIKPTLAVHSLGSRQPVQKWGLFGARGLGRRGLLRDTRGLRAWKKMPPKQNIAELRRF